MLLLLLLFLLALPLIFSLVPRRSKIEQIHLPPGPKGLPLIGNLHKFDPSKPHIYFDKLAKIYGPILSLRFGSAPAVVVQSAKIAKEVLQTQDLNFCYRPSLLGNQRLSYNGLDIAFAHSLEYFREVKKTCVVHLLSSKRVESFSLFRQDEVFRMINKVSTICSSSEIVNLSDLLMNFASSNICRTAFGKRYDDEGSQRSKFHGLLNDAQAMITAFFFADYFPSIGWLDKLTGQSSRLEKTFKDLDAFYDEIINDHLDPNMPEKEHADLIDVLLHLREERAFSFELTVDHIKAILMNMFVAGTDTSAAMVVWAMTELIKNPIAMRKVQEELRNSIGNKGYVTADDLPKLEYLKAVIKETFRFRPAAPMLIVREALNKCTIEGYDILPKTLVFVNVWAIGRDPNSWKDDPEIFMPERFLGSSIDYKGHDFELLPFGAGRRMCPGMLLGVANFELALANLLYSFDWELPVGNLGMKMEDIDTDTLPGVTMHKKNPLCLKATKYL